MLKVAIAILFLIPNIALGATIYMDGQLAVNCSSNNYSIANRTCTGKDGNAYNNIQSALTASAANDTIYFRPGSITSNATDSLGIVPKNGQSWAQYPGDVARSTTITAGVSHFNVFHVDTVNDVTIRVLVLVGGSQYAVCVGAATRAKIINNEVRGYNTSGLDGVSGIGYVAFGAVNSTDGEITDNFIHGAAVLNVAHAGITLVANGGSGG